MREFVHHNPSAVLVGTAKEPPEAGFGALRGGLGASPEIGPHLPGPLERFNTRFLHLLAGVLDGVLKTLVLLAVADVEPDTNPQAEYHDPWGHGTNDSSS